MALTFEWNPDKAAANLEKHGVGFTEATTVFRDPLSSTIPDPDHSKPGEVRELTIGLSHRSRLIVVAHRSRGRNIRIITARTATRRERKAYTVKSPRAESGPGDDRCGESKISFEV